MPNIAPPEVGEADINRSVRFCAGSAEVETRLRAAASAYAALNAAAAALARRVSMTGLKVATAGVRYVIQDDGSAQQISTVGQSIQV